MSKHFRAALIAPLAFAFAGAAAQNLGAAQATVQAAIDGVMSAIHADPAARGGDPDAVERIVDQKFLPHTDFLRTTRYAVGKPWAQATPAQQQALFTQFQTLLARTYATQLLQTSGQEMRFRFPPAPPSGNASDAVVKTEVTTGGDTMAIDYRLAKTDAGWKIYDINMMGAWMIEVYRQQFADQIAKNGIDGLVRFLAQHNQK